MGKQRVRRRRRREFPKPDAAIVTLAALVVLLLLLWGGLYMRETSGRNLADGANAEERTGFAPATVTRDNSGLPPSGTDDAYPPESGQPSVPDESIDSEARPDRTTAEPETRSKPESAPEAKSGDLPTPEETGSATEPESPGESESGQTEDSATEIAGATDSVQPQEPPSNSAVSRTRNYEREIKEIQAHCTTDMKEALSAAESDLRQVDKRDPIAVQGWQTSLTEELAAAESDCDSRFRELTRDAENDSVSPAILEEWERSFGAVKEEIRTESNAKAKQLIGG
ncbi:hypothetical protein ACF3MZ_00740 [Paenibacillaceae bacterium WGS1546]|uniref:hypothetical protein n=1 Tax=Cohnella sp. WGS1546 TaxID=3366810 RepID=UPI00372D75BA